jgi:hypothetical protein
MLVLHTVSQAALRSAESDFHSALPIQKGRPSDIFVSVAGSLPGINHFLSSGMNSSMCENARSPGLDKAVW